MSDLQQALQKEVNGHEMTIHFHHEMSGAVDELIWWCHTCDTDGKATFSVEASDFSLKESVRILNNYAEEHANA